MFGLYAWLLLITLISMLFGSGGFAPLDPRTGQPVSGIHLEFPLWAALFEPLTALAHIFQTQPDYRIGLISISAWIVVLAALASGVLAGRRLLRTRDKVLYGCRNSLIVLLLLVLYVATPLTSHFPNWAIQKDVPSLLVTDLHSHSMLSHDGVVAARQNLMLHQKQGFDVVAFTDYVNPHGPFEAYRDGDPSLPEAMPGIELATYYGGHFYVTVMGVDPDTPLPNGLAWMAGTQAPMPPKVLPPYVWTVRKLVGTVHEHHGVVMVVGMKLDSPRDVYGLADAGVDGFEYVNYGHWPLSDAVRHAMLDVQRKKGVLLVASNDWHGWSGSLNASTLVTGRTERQLLEPYADVLLEALRHHDSSHIVPAVAYPVHVMGWLEGVAAPFNAVFLYARTISPGQLVAWWFWALVFTLICRRWETDRASDWRDSLQQVSLERRSLLWLLLAAGIWNVSSGMSLMYDWFMSSSQEMFCLKISCYTLFTGLSVLFLDVWLYNRWVGSFDPVGIYGREAVAEVSGSAD